MADVCVYAATVLVCKLRRTLCASSLCSMSFGVWELVLFDLVILSKRKGVGGGDGEGRWWGYDWRFVSLTLAAHTVTRLQC